VREENQALQAKQTRSHDKGVNEGQTNRDVLGSHQKNVVKVEVSAAIGLLMFVVRLEEMLSQEHVSIE